MSAKIKDEEVCRIIEGAISRVAAKGGVKPGMSLRSDLGIDSLGLMSIVFTLEEKLGVDAFGAVERFAAADLVSDIIEILREI